MGKGSSPRPYSVTQKTFGENWDAIFKKKEQPKQTEEVKDKKDEVIRPKS